MIYAINEVVEQIGKIAIEGNIIPNEWYTYLRNDKGKIQTNAALILADIVYWYRPIPIYDIKTGQVTGHGKKFKDDLLQLSYKYFYDKFGFSENQSRNALIFLEENQLIFREYRDILVNGHTLNNVMYIGVYAEKISEISGKLNSSLDLVKKILPEQNLAAANIQSKESIVPSITPKNEKDWSERFSIEQKNFLSYLLDIKPEVGDPIEKKHATWWIKNYGIEKIKIALQVYWQRVKMAKQDSIVPMPQHIGKYVRKALNDGILPDQSSSSIKQSKQISPYSKKCEQVVEKFEIGPQKNETTNTQTSLIYMSVNEVNDKRESLTFQKKQSKEDTSKKEEIQLTKSFSHTESETHKKPIGKYNKNPDWSLLLSSEEKKFLTFLLSIKPEIGDRIEEKSATWWIKHFGVEKIKTALQVYWQQIEKAKKDSKIPIPKSIGAYVREALNQGTQPCRESDNRNRVFAEQFKKQVGWRGLTITQKYCRAEEIGKEWYYNLPEVVFTESLKNSFENYCIHTDRQSYVA